MTDELRAGDELELRGAIGGYFVWREELDGHVQLIAGAPFERLAVQSRPLVNK